MWQLKIFDDTEQNIFENVNGVDIIEDAVAEDMCRAFDRYTLLESAQEGRHDFDDIYDAEELYRFAYERIDGELLEAIEDVVANPSNYAYPAFTLAYYND